MSDTIAAIASGSVVSAIGIIRLSGGDSVDIIDKVFRPAGGGSMADAPSRKLIYGELLDKSGSVIDLCLCTVSRAPSSYTGEDTAELQCHGSPTVLRLGLEALFAAGARQAGPGEFTKRAFLNGRLDLSSAEAVIDLISAETAEAARNAASQLGGAIARKTDAIYDKLVDITSHFHAVLDYPDEDIEPFEIAAYAESFSDAERELERLLRSFERGRIMTEGVAAAIVGRPNVGKSSLMNALLGYERAIVTDVPGTTRDFIEEKLVLGGVKLRLSDTAGLRDTADRVERLGVERSRSVAGAAELVLAVFDGSSPMTEDDAETLAAAKAAPRAIAVINKADLPQRLEAELGAGFDAVCHVSALTGAGLEQLGEAVRACFPADVATPAGEILTNARQADAVARALDAIRAASSALGLGETPDIVLTEAEQAMSALGELSGRTVREDVTARIFERFCVGK